MIGLSLPIIICGFEQWMIKRNLLLSEEELTAII